MAITTRSGKGVNLTANEVDNNFLELSGSLADILDGSTLTTSASYALTASYAMNGGGGGIQFYDQGQLLGTKSKINFIGTGIEAYLGDVDPSMVIVSSEAGVSITIPDVVNYSNVRELEFTSGGVSFTGSENYPGYQKAIVNSSNLLSVSSDILPTTDGIYDLGASNKKWFDGYFANSVALGDVTLSNDSGSISLDGDIITTGGISADIANIGTINIIEDTISVDVDAAAEYSGIPSTVKIGSGLQILGSTYGSKYILVNGNGTPEENGAELQAAYDYAKEQQVLNPPSSSRDDSGNLVIDTNDRFSVVISPGEYSFTTGPFTIDTSNIDVVSLTGNPDVYISTTLEPTEGNPVYASVWVKEPSTSVFTLTQNITVRGINTGKYQFRTGVYHPSILIENCKGGGYSFAFGLAQDYPTPHMNELNRPVQIVLKNCVGGIYSFHPFTANNQCTYIDCVGGNFSFFYEIYGTASVTCIRCTGGTNSFGYFARQDIYGTFIECEGGNYSFASSPNGGFTPAIGATFRDCRAGEYSFGFSNTLYGKFIGCIAGSNSFVSNSGTNSGMIINCMAQAGASTLFASTGQGIIRNCINPSGALVNS